MTDINKKQDDWTDNDKLTRYSEVVGARLRSGEAMGVAEENVLANFSGAKYKREYRRVFCLAKKFDQAIDCAEAVAVLVGHSLLEAHGEHQQPQALAEIAHRLGEVMDDQLHLTESLLVFAQEIERLRAIEDEAVLATAFERLMIAQDVWVVLAAEVCQQKDPSLVLEEFLPEVEQLAEAI